MLENFKQNRTITGKPLAPELAADIVKAAERFPNTRLAVIFTDDLPHYDELWAMRHGTGPEDDRSCEQLVAHYKSLVYSRKMALTSILTDVLGNEDVAKNQANGIAEVVDTLAPIVSMRGESYVIRSDDKTEYCERPFFHSPPPFASVLLSATTISSKEACANSDGPLSAFIQAAQDPVSRQRCYAAHEFKHLDIFHNNPPQTRWEHELLADRAALSEAKTMHNSDSIIAAELHDRALCNMVSDISHPAAYYWNQPTQLSISDFAPPTSYSPITHHADVAAMLEVKQRAAAYLRGVPFIPQVVSHDPASILACFNDQSYADFRGIYDLQDPDRARRSLTLMHALGRVVEDGVYTHKGSRQIAELTLEAAQSFTPGLMDNPTFRKKLRDKPAFLAA